MALTDDVEHWIWLALTLGPASAHATALAQTLGGARAVYEADARTLDAAGCSARVRGALLAARSLEKARAITADCLKKGYAIVTAADARYPAALRASPAPPAVLYLKGSLPEADALCIAMVGTRRITAYGAAAAERLAMGLARAGVRVVSGLAAGVDACAHRGALKGGGNTYAVLGCGLDIVYPAANRALYALIAQHGGLLSEYPPDTPPLPFRFPLRNRIIAGLCAGTVVVEAGAKSGSLITAGMALEAGRDVFAVPGSIFSAMSEGTHRLLREGAKPACSVADILEEYRLPARKTAMPPVPAPQLSLFDAPPQADSKAPTPDAAKKEAAAARQAAPAEPMLQPPPGADAPAAGVPDTGASGAQPPGWGLTERQRALLALLSASPCHVDELAARAGLPSAQVLAALTVLEIQGLARSVPGRRFCKAAQPGV